MAGSRGEGGQEPAAVPTPGHVECPQRLPRVLHESPAAVLLVDLDERAVVQVNPAARALGPASLTLPVPVATWVAEAEVHPVGAPAGPPAHGPVERVAAGEHVHGEPVLVGGRMRWVTGWPIDEPPGEATRHALAVLFDVDTGGADLGLQERAIVAAGLSFTISDPRQPDNPLIFVNPAFERATGYTPAEVLGRNCRLLQGPATDPAAVQQLRDIQADGVHGTVTLLNYRRDGSAFWNEVSMSPVHDASGSLTHYVGIQADVTTRVAAEHERERHLQSEQVARADAERAQRQLALLAEATSLLAATLDVDESVDRLLGLVVPLLADWCTVQLAGEDGRLQRVVGLHRDEAKLPLLRRLEQLQPTAMRPESLTARALGGAPPALVPRTDHALDRASLDDELKAVYRRIGVGSAMVLPMRARRQVLGVLALHATGRQFDEEDLATAADLARRAALAIDNARLYQREHHVAEQLQRSLLPSLPVVPGLDCAARYRPGSTAAQVGGDWYDLFRLPDGTVGLAIGDVMGHDLTAAASMGQLRSVLQSYAWQGSSPAVVLDRLDQLVQGLDMAQLATCVYGRLDLPGGDAPGRLVLTNAGHLPPVLRAPDGSVRQLGGPPSLLVGAVLGTERAELTVQVVPGSMLVLCTDGLVEHRGRGIDEGLAALELAVASAPDGDAEAVCEHLLSELVDGALDDDVAILVVRVL